MKALAHAFAMQQETAWPVSHAVSFKQYKLSCDPGHKAAGSLVRSSCPEHPVADGNGGNGRGINVLDQVIVPCHRHIVRLAFAVADTPAAV